MHAALPFAALLGALAFGDAPTEPVRVEWRGHAECPDSNAFWSALVSRSNRVRLASSGEEARKVTVELLKSATGSSGRVSIDGAEPRTIAAATCEEVVDAIAIVTALVLDPTATTTPSAPSPPSPPPAAPESAPLPANVSASSPVPPARVPPPAPPTAKTWRWSAGAGVDVFATRGIGAVLTTPLSLEVSRDVSVRLNLSRGRSGVVRNAGGPAARFVWSTARIDVCLPRGRAAIDLLPCVGMEGGSLRGEPSDVDRPRATEDLWLAAHLLARLSFALGPVFSLELEGSAAFALTRPDFYVDPDYFLYRPGPFVFHLRGGLMVRFR